MLDPNRLNRVHVVNVRHDRQMGFFVVLSDGSEMTWPEWIASGCATLAQPGHADV